MSWHHIGRGGGVGIVLLRGGWGISTRGEISDVVSVKHVAEYGLLDGVSHRTFCNDGYQLAFN